MAKTAKASIIGNPRFDRLDSIGSSIFLAVDNNRSGALFGTSGQLILRTSLKVLKDQSNLVLRHGTAKRRHPLLRASVHYDVFEADKLKPADRIQQIHRCQSWVPNCVWAVTSGADLLKYLPTLSRVLHAENRCRRIQHRADVLRNEQLGRQNAKGIQIVGNGRRTSIRLDCWLAHEGWRGIFRAIDAEH